MTQTRPGKILSTLSLNNDHIDLFLGCPCTPKYVFPIKVWITPYIPSICHVLCQCGIRLGCYIHPRLGTQRPRQCLPHYRLRVHTEPLLYHNFMTQPRLGKILSAIGLNKDRTNLFLRCPYTLKRVLPIKVWITPYIPSISLVFCRCGIHLGCYTKTYYWVHIFLVLLPLLFFS